MSAELRQIIISAKRTIREDEEKHRENSEYNKLRAAVFELYKDFDEVLAQVTQFNYDELRNKCGERWDKYREFIGHLDTQVVFRVPPPQPTMPRMSSSSSFPSSAPSAPSAPSKPDAKAELKGYGRERLSKLTPSELRGWCERFDVKVPFNAGVSYCVERLVALK